MDGGKHVTGDSENLGTRFFHGNERRSNLYIILANSNREKYQWGDVAGGSKNWERDFFMGANEGRNYTLNWQIVPAEDTFGGM